MSFKAEEDQARLHSVHSLHSFSLTTPPLSLFLSLPFPSSLSALFLRQAPTLRVPEEHTARIPSEEKGATSKKIVLPFASLHPTKPGCRVGRAPSGRSKRTEVMVVVRTERLCELLGKCQMMCPHVLQFASSLTHSSLRGTF